ncbi:acyl-CoA N-acyltransferase [Xylariaceae sp. FL0804]|nr:acyl-CoA N-acyltransferase [Xylariaceae sp. FL0804]
MAALLRSERLIYRAVEEEDDPILISMAQDFEAHLNLQPFMPQPSGKRQLAKQAREWCEKGLLAAIICLPAPTGSGPEGGENKPIPIGYLNIAGPEARYGSEAIRFALQWGFRHAALHRIGIGAFSRNEGAVRLYKRLGFIQEAQKRDMFWVDGAYTDLIELGMLEHDWREKYESGSN